MVLFSLLIFSFVIGAPKARATDPEFQKIVSYSQLMTLSPAQRADYLRHVRLMVAEFEAQQKIFDANSPRKTADSVERNLFLDMMIRDAEAEAETGSFSNRSFGASYSSYYACPPKWINALHMERRMKELQGAGLQCLSSIYAKCASGFSKVATYQGNLVCYRPGVSKALIEAHRRAKEKMTAQQALKIKADKAARKLAFAKKRKAPAATTASAKFKNSADSKDDSTDAQAAEAADNADTAAKGGDADSDTSDSSITGTTADEDDHQTVAVPEFAIDATPDLKLGKRTESDGSCKDEPTADAPESCTQDSIDKARKDHFLSKAPHCIYAGNLRHYQNLEKRPGQCQAPREFCLSNVACKNPDGSWRNENDHGTILHCDETTQKNYVMCNPLVFNLDENDKALCIPASTHATEDCNKAAEAVEDKVGKDKYQNFITRIHIKGADSAKSDTNLDGVADAWNEYATAMNDLCFGKTTADLYCRECAVLKYRAARLNLVYFSKRQADGDGNCYKFRRLNRKTDPSVTPKVR